MADPYFKSAPSMQPAANKTAICFHAKDDLPEVRYEVIKLLPSLGVKATIGIRRKEHLARLYRPSCGDKVKKCAPDTVYDDLITEIFRDNLRSADRINLVFARRGRRKRHKALQDALAKARRSAESEQGKKPHPSITISFAHPRESAGLQVADYCLWAVQRMYARSTDDRFFRALESQYALVLDLDDKRNDPRGER